jgi:hypothetical protein
VRPLGRAALAGIAVGTVLLRLPRALTPGQLSFDDGVYGASAVALRHGARPFADVFSGQGPLYLPLLRAADLAGLQATWAPRLLGLASAFALVLAAAFLALAGGGRRAAFVAALLVATSGLLFRTTTTIEADPVASALGACAVLVAVRRGPPWLLGLLAAAALSVKSLLVAPAVLAAGVVYLLGRGWRSTGAAAVVTVAGTLALAIPFGLGDVWGQSIRFHLDARDGLHPGANLSHVVDVLWRYALLLLAVAAVAALAAIAAVTLGRRRRAGDTTDARLVALGVSVWLAGDAAVLLLHSPVFAHHVAVVVAPAAVLVALARPSLPALAMAAVVLLPGQFDRAGWVLGHESIGRQERAIADLRRLVPSDGLVVTDAPGVAWWAGRDEPPWLIDLSQVRLDVGLVTRAEVRTAALEPGVCAVLVWSSRLAGLGRLQLPGYVVAGDYGSGRVLWLRTACSVTAPGTGP